MACDRIIKNIFLTGQHGVGKSCLIQRTLGNFFAASIGGFLTAPVYDEKNSIVSYRICPFNQNSSGWIFASRNWRNMPQYFHFGVDTTVFDEYGKSILAEACHRHQIVVMDELGFMEEKAYIFQKMVFQCLDAGAIVLGVIKPIRNHFLDKIRERSDVVVVEIQMENRDNIYWKLVDDICRLL